MATLTITRGLPGSGKTTWARRQPGAVRVNRDDLRRMLHGGPVGLGWAEVQVTIAQRAQVEALLRADVNVICDDTNLRSRVVRELAELALACGAEVAFRDFTDVPLAVCIARDATRDEGMRVGEDVIRGMWQRHLAGRTLPLPRPAVARRRSSVTCDPPLSGPVDSLPEPGDSLPALGDSLPEPVDSLPALGDSAA